MCLEETGPDRSSLSFEGSAVSLVPFGGALFAVENRGDW